ncbi:putative transposase [Shigella flexneri K-227]|uniref:Putative transposase n=1 Tax=Shigella flexneri K-227 TaxID=766147 RepID=F5NUP0_SHIFL|nr:putative transposase [Shigella flexneri K-272]EGK38062.1 putative transposase [Shigella flexneri K-227]
MPCFTAMRAEIALMSGSAFAVTHHAFSSGAGRTSDGNGSHASTLKSPSYTKSVSWQHYLVVLMQSADTLSFVIDKHMEVFAIKQLLFSGSGNFRRVNHWLHHRLLMPSVFHEAQLIQ